MKFNFKIQDYQTNAINSIINVFKGQSKENLQDTKYIRDLGRSKKPIQTNMLEDGSGFKNSDIKINNKDLLANIHKIQQENNIKLSKSLIKDFGACSLDVEMETGTGKTYVYIKTMFELNRCYGWNKFIVVVPSIAIREGVKKSFEMMEEHFMEHYKKKARFFVYNSSNLQELDSFSSSNAINVMIINTQAFTGSLKEGANNKDSRIIYSKRDEFASRRPIDVISANRPILILDEPQKMGGEATQKALKNFNPLFSLNYSATHEKSNNLIYVLDALEAYNQKLVKKIEVKGFELQNLKGIDSYLYLDSIELSSKNPPFARLEMEISYKNGIKREVRKIKDNDNLYTISNNMKQYEGYTVSEINPLTSSIYFTNGKEIKKGDIIGDSSDNHIRRIQIRETILSHFEKEEKLFSMGIKTLSLFFIDEVAKYREYDKDNTEITGEYGRIFEEEYTKIYEEMKEDFSEEYNKYLSSINAHETHKGYFSIDKKTGKSIDSTVKRGSDASDDISAYDLILKNKERLLSFKEPTRFLFSHSALSEGWDNPNVFQICTLKHSVSTTKKRQEVGRGLRICVDQAGNRMDEQKLENQVHDINLLTVIANESYNDFVTSLQKEIKEVLYDRPTKASAEYFEGKTISTTDEQGENKRTTIDKKQASQIFKYLVKNDYIDDYDSITDEYRNSVKVNDFAELPTDLKEYSEEIHKLIQSIFDENVISSMTENAHDSKVIKNQLNDNFKKKEFQELWKLINHKYIYKVDFKTHELITNSIKHIDKNLYVSELQYISKIGEQKEVMNEHELERKESFNTVETKTKSLNISEMTSLKYDLIAEISKATNLTRKTIAVILQGIKAEKFACFAKNPEEFITKVSLLINEQKGSIIVEHISYDIIEGSYESSIFTQDKIKQDMNKVVKGKKHIQDFVFIDNASTKNIKDSTEGKFVEDLEKASEVCVYAKLPRGFKIPTPVGNYSPDWAIAFNKDSVKHIFFIAETKGSMSSLQLRPIEKTKIDCAKKLFNEISTSKIKYRKVYSYQKQIDIVSVL